MWTYSVFERRLKRQHRGHTRWLRQTEQPIPNARQTRHEAGRVNAQRRATQVFIPIDALHDGARQLVSLDVPLLVREHLSGARQQLEVADIAVAERVILTKTLVEGCVQSGIDLS